MLDALRKRRHRAAHVAGVARHIDDGVELHAGERREAVRPVSIDTDKASARRNRSGNSSRAAQVTSWPVATAWVAIARPRNCVPPRINKRTLYTPEP
jgi:hypothetical protein